jgi:hypothetical protein
VIRTSETTKALFAALAAAQGEMPVVSKDSTAKVPMKSGGQYSYTYATLATVLEAIRPVLTKHGLVVTHGVTADGSKVKVETRVAHGGSGEWIETEIGASAASDTPQAIGSVVTYCRRYGVCALLSLATEDDDGEAGEGRAGTAASRSAPARTAPPAPAARAPSPAPASAPAPAREAAPARAPEPQSDAATVGDFTFDFGKHNGKRASEVETGYLEWLVKATESKPEKWRGKDWEGKTLHMLDVCRALIARHAEAKAAPSFAADEPPMPDAPQGDGFDDDNVQF